MTVDQDTLEGQLGLDLARACAELGAARTARSARDDTINRQAVVRCQARADALLDMHLAVARPRTSLIGSRLGTSGRPAAEEMTCTRGRQL
jgi:hypothetical protein